MRISPVERHREKVTMALRWLHGWQQSTAELLKLVCRSSNTNFLSSMREAGLAKIERVLGQSFWLLTRQGLELLRSMSATNDALANLAGTRNVNLHAFTHNMHTQRLLAQKIKKGPSQGFNWFCERELRARLVPEAGAKCPDGAYFDGSRTIYLEVERSRKKQPELEAMLLNLGRLIEGRPLDAVEIHILPGIADRYKSTLGGWLSTGEFRAWSLSTEDELYESGRYDMQPSLRDALKRIQFLPLVE
jgi:hypothetical protein